MIKDQVSAAGKKAVEDFKSFSPGQKAMTLFAVVALAVGGYLLFTWKADPSYAPLYNNLAATDASAVADKLTSNGISYKLANGGSTIEVPTADVDKARLEIASAGLPNGGNSGYTLLDKEGVTTSQFQQQVDYQRAVEGELAKTIQTIQGVQAASVHLAIPQDTVFNDGTTAPTAAVLLTVAPGTQLTSSQVQSVVYLVSSSVTGMKAGGVTVTDSQGNVLSAPGTGTTGITAAGDQAKQTTDYDNRIAASIQSMLDQALGQGHASVQVNAQLDFNKTSTTKNSYVYTPNTPAVSSSQQKETYTGTGAGAAGTLGTTDTTGTAGGSGNGKYAKTSTVVNNALGTISSTTQNAPGALQNLHIAVMVDKSVKGLNVPALTQLIQSGVGFNQPRGDTLSVQSMAFDTTAQKQAAAATKQATAAAAAAKAHDALMSMIKQGVLVAIVLAVVLGTWLASRKRAKRGAVTAADRDEDELIDDLTDLDAPTTQLDATPAPPAQGGGLEAAQQRKLLVAAADNRPADLAHVLSGWLSPSEEAKS